MISDNNNLDLHRCQKCTHGSKTPSEICFVESLQNARKVLVFGLYNSGKTGMIYGLKAERIDNEIKFLKPSRGRDISRFLINDKKYFVWDHGGTFRYRKRWLNNLEKLAGFDELIYVINPLNRQKYQESLSFLQQLLTKLYFKQLGEIYTVRPKLTILLHKCDLCKSSEQFEKYHKQITEFLEQFSVHLEYSLFRTSIYNLTWNKVEKIKEGKQFKIFGNMLGYVYSNNQLISP